MNIMIICGSPRPKGNTMTVVNWVAEGAKSAGATVEIVNADELEYKANGCRSCMGCQRLDEFACVVEDDAADVINRIPDQDVLVLASPVYFFGVSAQLKLILDRMYCLYKFDGDEMDLAPGLEDLSLAFVGTAGGGTEDGLQLAEDTIKTLADFTNLPFTSFLVPYAPKAIGALQENGPLRLEAIAFGEELAEEMGVEFDDPDDADDDFDLDDFVEDDLDEDDLDED